VSYNILSYTVNELGYTTLSVAEPRRGVSVGALFAEAKKRDGGQCAFRPSEGESPERSVSAAVSRSSKTILHFRQEVRFLI
jgi:hypothetical protein